MTEQPSAEQRDNRLLPLCVDLDGTLIRGDLLIESALVLVGKHPLMAFAMFAWLLKGKAYLKAKIAQHTELDAASLPYSTEVLKWVRQQQSQRQTVLCTAADTVLAHRVAAHLGGFSEIIASDGANNLSGRNKAKELERRFGTRGFDYVGNARVDLHVWKLANAAIVVESGRNLSAAASRVTHVERVFHLEKPTLRNWLHALRVHQWIKNILVFLPLLAAHQLFDMKNVLTAALAFLCFGLCASSVYITNDLLDLTADRHHRSKKHRPFAAGVIPVYQGIIAAICLLLAAFAAASLLSQKFAIVLGGYYLLTTAYSLRLKRVSMLDVIVLAMLYTSRILAGAAAIKAPPTFWLLAFSMFFFLSLAMVKRYTELIALQRAGSVETKGRGYDVGDIPLIQALGGASGYLAVLVLAMYINSPASEVLYRDPHWLWALCPILLYWISRTWALAHRGVMHDDPVVFAVMDRTSRILVFAAAVAILMSI
jgi:4-hydroxybenzoate polyprenyltransferase